MSEQRPFALSIAGFDPCGGAGILADIKTFEAIGVNGLGICTAITYQNDSEFKGVDWLSWSQIEQQLSITLKKYNVQYIKVGLIENLDILAGLIHLLSEKNIKMIWDPILKASAGFPFHKKIDQDKLANILQHIYLLTPNLEEAKILFHPENHQEIIKNKITNENICAILLKGGHAEGSAKNDTLFTKEKISVFEGENFHFHKKHGTGCVLSAAITANLANGVDIELACKNAKEYVHSFMLSSEELLGYHNNLKCCGF